MRMSRNNISCFVLQNTPTWLTRINSLARLARLLLLAKEAENANSHNSHKSHSLALAFLFLVGKTETAERKCNSCLTTTCRDSFALRISRHHIASQKHNNTAWLIDIFNHISCQPRTKCQTKCHRN